MSPQSHTHRHERFSLFSKRRASAIDPELDLISVVSRTELAARGCSVVLDCEAARLLFLVLWDFGAVKLNLRTVRMAGFMVMSRAPVSRFARRFSRSLGLPVLTSLGDLAYRSLASLDGHHDEHRGFVKQLRLTGSFMAIFHAPVSRFARRLS